MKQLILGGARSGKSSQAERLAQQTALPVTYIATADRRHNDAEMHARVQHHQQRRPDHWQTLERPIQLAALLDELSGGGQCVLVDCLTLWVSNCLLAGDATWHQERDHLLVATETFVGELIFVSNEVGQGVIPMDPLSRRFVDESGFLHQALVPQCERVVFTTAGLPTVLKGPSL